jgi:hypothetical protein
MEIGFLQEIGGFARGPTGLWFNSHELHDFIPATLLECHLQLGGLGFFIFYFYYYFLNLFI